MKTASNKGGHRVTCVEFLALLVFNLLLFQPILEALIPTFSYFDECLTLVAIAFLGASLPTMLHINNKALIAILVFLLVIIGVGLYENMASEIASDLFYIAVDVIACTKFFFIYLALRLNMKNMQFFMRYLAVESKVLLVIMFVCLVVNQLHDIGMTYEHRYGLKSFQFIYIHPTHMVTLCLACFVAIYVERKRGWAVYFLIAVLLIFMSLRSRWMALALVMLLIVLFDDGKKQRVSFGVVAVCSAIAILIGRSQMTVYYGDASESARGQLTSAASDILCQWFPLGAGFATFGSGATKTTYSPLYYEYGLDQVYGLAPDNPCYLTDTFWPVIFAQFGFIGLLAWIGLLAAVMLDLYRLGKRKGILALPLIFIAVLLISTTASGSVFSMQMITLEVVFLAAIQEKPYEKAV
ncbi:O-antigen ligase [Adlercreutzia sp. ZJ242]|uniref:O-antigen ligase family protein n=1 Tax=Adlercreutzia sp. ZJ242 TaxID=2709409 RepID=UPI0013EC29F8|nr:hypothetical protein [Adlercreutzia sp. ZJ242]